MNNKKIKSIVFSDQTTRYQQNDTGYKKQYNNYNNNYSNNYNNYKYNKGGYNEDDEEPLNTGGEYNRQDKNKTEECQNTADINEKLKDCVELSDEEVSYLKPNQFVRYITLKDGKEMFRLGGCVERVDPDYVILKGANGITFPVKRKIPYNNGQNTYITHFYKKLNKYDILNDNIKKMTETIDKKDEEIQLLKNTITEMKETIFKLKQYIKSKGL